jgi:hypothetical protein
MRDMADLTYAGAAVQAERLAAGEVSAQELVDLALERIDATQDAIGAFRVVRHEAARAAAADADRRLAGQPEDGAGSSTTFHAEAPRPRQRVVVPSGPTSTRAP